MVPFLTTWLDDPRSTLKKMPRIKWLEFCVVLLGLCAVTAVAFVLGNPYGAALAPMSYVPMLILFFIALRYSLGALTISSAMFATIAIACDARGNLDPNQLQDSLTALQLFLISSVASALLFSSLLRKLASDAEKLKKSHERFQLAIRGANDGLWDWDLLNDTLYLSPRWTSMLGYDEGEIPADPEAALSLIHHDDIDRVRAAYAASVPDPNVSYDIEFRMRHKDGHWVDIKSVGFVERDDKGRPVRFAGTHSDISERKLVETALRQTQRMETVGQLTGGIAHDFNNLLAIILGNLELLERHQGLDAQARELVNRALATCERAAALTRKLLSFSRRKSGGSSLVRVNDKITGMEHLLSRSLTASIQLKLSLEPNLWDVVVDPDDLENMILNLAVNSRDAMPKGGVISIETSNQLIDESFVRLNPGSRCGAFVRICITDTGSGMSADVLERAFEPFFTTKGAGKGTGLGLSMAYGFVQRSSGFVKVESEMGEGTSFGIFLPRAEEPREAPLVPQEKLKQAPGGCETILVLDDEEMLAQTACSHLETLGYTTIKAKNPIHALTILEGNPDVDLLFSDVIMPGAMNGYKLALEAHAAYPSLKVMLTSGFIDRDENTVNGDAEYAARLTATLLPKPYSLDELAYSVRKILDEVEA